MGATRGSRGIVLVVEDEPLVRMVAAATFEDAGFERRSKQWAPRAQLLFLRSAISG
jgi:hypothetical protein